VLRKLYLDKAYDHVNWEFFALFVEEMQIWGEMEGLDSALYIYKAVFHSCEWFTVPFFELSWWLWRH
jgi:hypothetical protein